MFDFALVSIRGLTIEFISCPLLFKGLLFILVFSFVSF